MSKMMNTLSVEEARHKLRDRKLAYVAEQIGMTYMSLHRLVTKQGNPSLMTLQKLTEYFESNK